MKSEDTQYNDTIFVTNDWRDNDIYFWVKYSNDKSGDTYFSGYLESGQRTSGTLKVSPYKGVHDLWTISILNSAGHLWSTNYKQSCGLPDKSISNIELLLNATDQKAEFHFPDGSDPKSIEMDWFGSGDEMPYDPSAGSRKLDLASAE